MHILSFFLLAVTFGLGWSVFVYKAFAQSRGWPVGEMLSYHNGRVSFFVLGGLLGIAFIAFDRGPWWWLIVVPVAGIALSFVISEILKSLVQSVARLAFVLGIATNIFIGH